MTYKLVRKLTDLEMAIADYKWRLISENELLDKLRAAYTALEEDLFPKRIKKDGEGKD